MNPLKMLISLIALALEFMIWNITVQAQAIRFFKGPDLNEKFCGGPPSEDCFVVAPLMLSGINDLGELTGHWFVFAGPVEEIESVFVNASGDVSLLPNPGLLDGLSHGHGYIIASKINQTRTMVGTLTAITTDSNGDFISNKAAFVASPSSVRQVGIRGRDTIDLISINDNNDVLGSFTDRNGAKHHFLDNKRNFGEAGFHSLNQVTIPNIASPTLTDLNNLNQLVGSYPTGDVSTTSLVSGFIFKNGQAAQLNVPGASYTLPQSINNLGDVVGYYNDGFDTRGFPGPTRGFTYFNGQVQTFNVEAQPLDSTGQQPGQTLLLDVNDYRDVVGFGFNFERIANEIGIADGSFVLSYSTP